jgi:GT2 family glycosyltransferase
VDGPKVSIIIVNWNGEDLLEHCLASVTAQSYCAREVVLVDNGSTDSSVPFTRQNFPSVKIVELSTNKGFTGGNSEGLKIADGEFISLVNNDARVERIWLENLIQPMLKNPAVGSCASKVIFDNGSTINSAGDGLTTAGVGFNRGLSENVAQFNEADLVFGACGAAVLYRRRMLEEIGFLDEEFFLYDEDTDLNFRAQLAGWKCVYVPNAVVYHKGNATAGRLSDSHIYYHTRNLEFVWIKNMPVGLMLRFAHHKFVQEVGSFCYLCLRHGKWTPFFHAKCDALKMLPRMWAKRHTIQSHRRVSSRYIKSLMTSMFTPGFIWGKILQFIFG